MIPVAPDVVVAGGGPAGLAAASELARAGYSVRLLEEDLEIGYPVKCAGIVSRRGADALRGACGRDVTWSRIARGVVEVRGMRSLEVDMGGLDVVAIDRRALERCLFEAASSNGAEVALGERAVSVRGTEVLARGGTIAARAVVDARGASAYPRRGRVLHAVQYTCRGGSRDGSVRVLIDKSVTREYFAWRVDLEGGDVLLGGAGSSPSRVEALLGSLAREGGCAPYRIVRSPIVVGGFAGPGSGGAFPVGDAAGATKPLTGGGDVWGFESSLMAARHISQYLSGEIGLEEAHRSYSRSWRKAHGKEESLQLLLRSAYERMGEADAWRALVAMRDAGVLRSPRADFDALGSWALASLGARAIASMAIGRIRDALGIGRETHL